MTSAKRLLANQCTLAVHFQQREDYQEIMFDLLAFLVRYGPKSVNEVMAQTTSWNRELAGAIGRLMEREKSNWEQGLLTGDS